MFLGFHSFCCDTTPFSKLKSISTQEGACLQTIYLEMFICLGFDLRGCQHCARKLKERCVEGGLVGKNWTLNCTSLTYLNFHKLHQIELIVSKNLSNEGNWLWISLLNLNLAQHIQVAFQNIAKIICRIKTSFFLNFFSFSKNAIFPCRFLNH